MKKTIVRCRGEEVVEVEEIQDSDSIIKEIGVKDIFFCLGLIIIGGIILLVLYYLIGQYNSSSIVNPICIICSTEEASTINVNVNLDMPINQDYTIQTEAKETIEQLGE